MKNVKQKAQMLQLVCKWVYMRVLVRFMRYPALGTQVPSTPDWTDKWSFNKLRVTLGVIFSAHKSFCLRYMRLFAAAACLR